MNSKKNIELLALLGICAGGLILSGCRTQYSYSDYDGENGDASFENSDVQPSEVYPEDAAGVTLLDDGQVFYADDEGSDDLPSHMKPAASGEVVYATPKGEKEPQYWETHDNPYAEAMASQTKSAPKSTAKTTSKKPVADKGYVIYIVQKNDTLGHIAKRHGVSLKDVKALNANINYNRLKVGQRIYLPAKAAKSATASSSAGISRTVNSDGYYVVKSGDILGRIAREFGVTVSAIKAANNLKSDRINVGQKLLIPGKKATATTKSTAAAPKKAAPAAAAKPKTESKGKAKTVVDVKPFEDEAPAAPAAKEVIDVPTEIPAPILDGSSSMGLEVPVIDEVPAPVLEAPKVPALDAPAAPAPEVKPTKHTVSAGEDLMQIRVMYGVSEEDIKAANPGLGDVLVPGSVILIPVQVKK